MLASGPLCLLPPRPPHAQQCLPCADRGSDGGEAMERESLELEWEALAACAACRCELRWLDGPGQAGHDGCKPISACGRIDIMVGGVSGDGIYLDMDVRAG